MEHFSDPAAWRGLKPGFKSTEAALAAFSSLVATALNVLPYVIDHLPPEAKIAQIAATALAAAKALSYITGRTALKKAAIEKGPVPPPLPPPA